MQKIITLGFSTQCTIDCLGEKDINPCTTRRFEGKFHHKLPAFGVGVKILKTGPQKQVPYHLSRLFFCRFILCSLVADLPLVYFR